MVDVNEISAVELFDLVWRRIRHELAAAGQAIAPELRPSQRRVLARTPPDGMRVGELADRTSMTAQSLGQYVEVLRHLGYLESIPDPHDRRVRLIRPTPRGREAGAAARRELWRLEERWAAAIGEPGWRQLRSVLSKLAASAPGGTSPPDRTGFPDAEPAYHVPG
jgi:DNA-binding MarR family transcriptional regulator